MENSVVCLTGPRQISLEPCPTEPLGAGRGAGADAVLGHLRRHRADRLPGLNPYLNKNWDDGASSSCRRGRPSPTRSRAGATRSSARSSRLGAGLNGVAEGQLVYGTWGHRASAVVAAQRGSVCHLPAGLAPLLGVFARLGAIALNSVLDADIHVGEIVAVFGQGVHRAAGGPARRAERRHGDRGRRASRPGSSWPEAGRDPRARRPRGRRRRADPRALGRPRSRRVHRDQRGLPGPARGDPGDGVLPPGSSARASSRATASACTWARSSTTTASRSSAPRSRA